MNNNRKLLLSVHVATATATLGTSFSALVMLAGWPAGRAVSTVSTATRLLTLGLASSALAVLTGLSVALLSPWGVFRYGWVVKKLGLTIAGFLVLAGLWAALRLDDGSLRLWQLEAGFAAVLTLSSVNTVLSIYKPGGRLRPARPDGAGRPASDRAREIAHR